MKSFILFISLIIVTASCTQKESYKSIYDVPDKTTIDDLEYNGFKTDNDHDLSNMYSKVDQLETVIITLDPSDLKTVIREEVWFKSEDRYRKKFNSKPFSSEVKLENGKVYQVEMLGKGVMMTRLQPK